MESLLVAFALLSVSCDCEPEPPRANAPDPTTAVPPPAPASVNLALSCRPPHPTCENPGFDMAVLADRVESCETMAGGTSIRLQLKSSNDEHDGIVVAFDAYHGPGSYSLDSSDSRFITVHDQVDFAQCGGGTIDTGKRVSAADPNCGSPACTVRVSDAAPEAPFPKPLAFTVHCTSLCENGSDVTCSGPIDFVTRADCT